MENQKQTKTAQKTLLGGEVWEDWKRKQGA